ncbi:hypothetical protein Tdes44962_MAKER00367 [Teratosphaeria destructans]|uniref:Uncharacterized protein n=1 Tax=Teratosphaeria destructans TaxID=418781 RepID=A0A9W7SRX0_9PEZI|nr:hypothetical protein Tdes44962_MAKER00367 [Teratosphaeria destructans]
MSNNPFTNHILPQQSGMSNSPFLAQQTQQGAGVQSARSSFDSVDLAKEGQQPTTAMPQQAQATGASNFSAAQMDRDVNEQMQAWRDPEALNNIHAFDRIQEPDQKRAKRKSIMLYLIIGVIVVGVGIMAVVGAVMLSRRSNDSEVSQESPSGANGTITETVTQTSYLTPTSSSSSSRSLVLEPDLSPSTTMATLSSSSSQLVSVSTTVVTSQIVATASSSSQGTTTVTDVTTNWSWTTVSGSPPPSSASTTSTDPTITSGDHCTTDVCVTPVPDPADTTLATSVQNRSADLVLSGYTTYTTLGLTMIEPIVATESSQTVTSEVTTTPPTTTTVSPSSSTTSTTPEATATGGIITFCGPQGMECEQKRSEVPDNLSAPMLLNGTEQTGNVTDSFTVYANGSVVVKPVYNITNSTSLFHQLGGGNASELAFAEVLQQGNRTWEVVEWSNGTVRGNLTTAIGRYRGVRK